MAKRNGRSNGSWQDRVSEYKWSVEDRIKMKEYLDERTFQLEELCALMENNQVAVRVRPGSDDTYATVSITKIDSRSKLNKCTLWWYVSSALSGFQSACFALEFFHFDDMYEVEGSSIAVI